MTIEVDQIRRSSRQLVRKLGFLNPQLWNMKISHSTAHCLIEIGESPGITSSEVCEQLSLDKSSVSKILKNARDAGLIEEKPDPKDTRRKSLFLSPEGAKLKLEIDRRANLEVEQAIASLDSKKIERIKEGLSDYSQAIERAKLRRNFEIRLIEEKDNTEVQNLIQQVMPEFGALGPGFAIEDAEVLNMHQSYSHGRSRYWVLEKDKRVVGGAGIAPLEGEDGNTCELRKMYFYKEARGLGFGNDLLELCLKEARNLGYRRIYLETLKHMKKANRLYKRFGFKALKGPRGDTGHFSCDKWMELKL